MLFSARQVKLFRSAGPTSLFKYKILKFYLNIQAETETIFWFFLIKIKRVLSVWALTVSHFLLPFSPKSNKSFSLTSIKILVPSSIADEHKNTPKESL
jgi:hypothetical protein